MKWLFATIGLLAASLCLLGWIYLRDRDTNWRPAETQVVQANVEGALGELPRSDCSEGCKTKILRRTGAHRWLVSITARGQTRCIQIELDGPAASGHGLSGIQPSPCTARASKGPAPG
jgi:hypothetical protein